MRPAGRRPDWVGLGWTGLALILILAHGLSFRFVVDDAFISFRYAQNLVDGHGLVFNPGQRVEGYSNLLWVLLAAAGLQTGCDPVLWSRLLGVGFTAGLLGMLPGVVRRLSGSPAGQGPWPGRMAQMLVTASGPVACWMLAGLETPLLGFLVVWAWRSALYRRPWPAALAGVLLVLCRPEGPALAAGFAAWSLLPAPGRAAGATAGPACGSGSWRAWLAPVFLAAGTAAFFWWRHAYFGWWLPNTYYAKTGDLKGQVRTGVPYGLAFLRAYAPALILAASAGVRLGRRRGPIRPPRTADLLMSLGFCAAWFAYCVLVGGDMLGMFRFLVPILPVLTTVTVVLLADAGRLDRGKAAACWALGIGLALLPGSLWGKERRLVTAHLSEANLGGWILAGDALARILPQEATLALGPAGYIPWRTGLVSYDFYGLVDPRIAHKSMAFTQGYAGHEKHDGRLVLERRPHYILIGNVDITDAPRTTLIPPLTRELDIVQDPVFQREYQQIFVPVAGGKVLNLFQRKDLAGRAQDPGEPAGAGKR